MGYHKQGSKRLIESLSVAARFFAIEKIRARDPDPLSSKKYSSRLDREAMYNIKIGDWKPRNCR